MTTEPPVGYDEEGTPFLEVSSDLQLSVCSPRKGH
jgi:hypothetical protein